jgi:hypothetical protein
VGTREVFEEVGDVGGGEVEGGAGGVAGLG